MGLLGASRLLAIKAVRCYLPCCPFSASKSWLSTKTTTSLGDRNILLMGPPGAGKTSVGRVVGRRLGLPVIDVDDDVLERAWAMPVAAKLAAVGGQRFLEEEGQVLCTFSTSQSTVVSLSGSNPLHAAGMRHVKRTGLVVYLDVDTEDIVRRLSAMKVNRIVGQEEGGGVSSMRKILRYRKQFYEEWFDTRVLCGTGDAIEDVAEKVLEAVRRFQDPDAETYVSTRRDGSTNAPKTYFSDVVLEGLAPDGGLYVPANGFPKIDAREWLRLADLPYAARASVILEKCIHPTDVPAADLGAMVLEAYGPASFASEAVAPVRHLAGNQYVQELFHGPTASFKDLALQLMPRLFAYCLPPACNYLVLVATSGDTGSAVLSGFSGVGEGRTGVLVFFPEDGVSQIQKLQMTAPREGNARAVGVRSDFDFCQRAIKRMFVESGTTGYLAVEYGTVLSTANSINWARLLPQVVYHASAYLDLFRDGVIKFGDPVDVCIPTGNFGNAMSALYAKQMGVPIRRVICASNQNRIVADFLATGECDLRGRPLVASHSPAIDILKSSNLERFIYHASGGDSHLVRELFTQLDRDQYFRVPEPLLRKMQQEVAAGWCSEEDCLSAIHTVHTQTGYIMDTHTAVAKVVSDRLQDGTCPVVICSTAHCGKFAPAVLGALQRSQTDLPLPEDPVEQLRRLGSLASAGPEMHERMLQCMVEQTGGQQQQQAHTTCQADHNALLEEVESMIQDSFLKVM